MYESGLARGRELGAKAKDRNDLIEFERLNIEDYIEQGENTPGFDDPARKWVKREKNHIIFNLAAYGPRSISAISEIIDDQTEMQVRIYGRETIRRIREHGGPCLQLGPPY